MSDRTVTTAPLKFKAAALVAVAALCGLTCGPFPGASAQPTGGQSEPGTKGKVASTEEGLNQLDRRPPIPADTPRRKAYDKLRIPNTDREIFAEIVDFRPVAAQDQNPREYDAWIEYVLHAKNQSARELN